MNDLNFSVSVLTQILNVLPDGILWVSIHEGENKTEPSTNYLVEYINASACKLLNVTEEAIVGQNLLSNESNQDEHIKHLLLDASTHTSTYFSKQSQKWLCVEKQRIDAGFVIRLSDITYNKEQQQRIEKLADKLQQAIETSQAGTFYTSPIRNEQGEIIDWVFNTANQTISSIVNLKPSELIGEPGSKWFPAYLTDGLFDQYVEVFNTGKPKRFDYNYYEEGKLDEWFDFMITKFGDELLITLTNFTTIKKLQLQLEEYVHELKRSNESLEQFAYAASHDLQVPLRKISIYIEKLEQQYADVLEDEGFSYIERIKTVTRRMRRLIQDLLVFAEVGSTHTALEPVDLTEVVKEVVNDLEAAIEERSGTVEVDQLGYIKGNCVHLQQLFQNLISNALKYSKVNVPSYISITSEVVHSIPVALTISEVQNTNRQYLLLKVKDNGQGFSDEQAKQIFKIFQRLPQHQHEYAGTGIGLAIVKRVVENHRGYIIAEGIPDEGATFSIYLPVT